MPALTEAALLAALQTVVDPNTGTDFVSTRQLKNLRIDGSDVAFDVELGPRLGLAVGTVGGNATTTTTTASSGSAPVVDGSAVLDLRVPLGASFAASFEAGVGGVVAGIDAHADGRRAAGFGGPVAGVGLGVGRAF